MPLLISFVLGFVLFGQSAFADGVVVYASEIGVAKFHRYDNKVHPYAKDNVWRNFIAPDDTTVENTPKVIANSDKSYTVIFSTLEELALSLIKIKQDSKESIQVFNINGHGLPGIMWYPTDRAALNSLSCFQWKDAAEGADEDNYKQYYSAVSYDEILSIRQIAEQEGTSIPCSVGLREWSDMAKKYPALKTAFSNDVKVHFNSCVVGLGKVGDNYAKGFAVAFLSSTGGRIEASLNLGLGDWSMPEGMGFWDFQNQEQLAHDNDIYVKDRRDRDIMQKGSIRSAFLGKRGKPSSGVIANRDFMYLDARSVAKDRLVSEIETAQKIPNVRLTSIRIPGTGLRVPIVYEK